MQFRENRSLLSQARASLLKTAIFVVALLAITGAVFSLLHASPVLAQAQDLGLQAASTFGLPTMDIRQIAVNIIRGLLGLLGLVALVIVLYAGFLWMTAGDEPKKVETSKKMLINGAIGLLIIVSAYAIVSFFFSALGYGGLFGGGATVGRGGEPGGFGGALGNGPIQSHYPPRNAVDVPRNTSIIVTFKEAINPLTVKSETGSVEVVTREQYDAGGTISPLTVVTIGTTDKKTFVFTPQQYLGSPDNAMGYVVILGSKIKKLDGKDVFTGRFTDYIWSFEVSNKLDVVPPTVTSVIPTYSNRLTSELTDENPHNNTVARNAIIQINFSEAVNPLTVSGEAKLDANGVLSFNNIVVANLVLSNNTTATIGDQNSLALTGRFEISNQYRTVEFTTDQECGVNSCGEKVYCLPGESQIQVALKSAILATGTNKNPDLPFLASTVSPAGVTDVANNAMDGNNDGKADDNFKADPANVAKNLSSNFSTYNLNIEDPAVPQSTNPPGDNYQWGFYTNNTIDLVPPTVVNYSPVAKAVGVQPTQQLTATFDKYLSSSSVKPDAGYGDGYCGCGANTLGYNKASYDLNHNYQCNTGETCNAVKGYCISSALDRIVCHKHTDGAECKPLPPVAPATTAPADQDETLCIEHEHVTLLQPANVESVGYYLMSQNDPNPLVTQSTSIMDHVAFVKNVQYGAYYGSGIRDLFQNCYIPNAAPGCPRVGGGQCATDNLGVAYTDAQALAYCRSSVGSGSVCQPNKTCSYVNALDWLGTYPNCDLRLSQITTYGSYNLGYATPVSQVNKTLLFPAFAWTKPDSDLVKDLTTIDYFKDFAQQGVASTWLYFSQGTLAGTGDLYLITYVGKANTLTPVAAPVSHEISFTIKSTNSKIVFSEDNLLRSSGQVKQTFAADSLKLDFVWTDNTSEYATYLLGSSNALSDLNLQISRVPVANETTPPVSQWQLIYPGGKQIMDLSTPITINAVDAQPPLVKSGDFKVQYSHVGTNYVIDITLNSKLDPNPYTDLAEAYVDWAFSETSAALQQYNLSAQALNDLGRNGDATAGDSIWSYQFTIPFADNAGAVQASTITLNHTSRDYAGNKVQKNGGGPADDILPVISSETVQNTNTNLNTNQ